MTGPAITAWRQRQQLSVAQLAHLLGVQRDIVSKWEHGRPLTGTAAVLLTALMQDDALLARLVKEHGVPRRNRARKKNAEAP